jgi:FkbM family methyltransferase
MKTISLPLPLVLLQQLDFPYKLGICEKIFASLLSKHGICWVPTGAGIPWKLDLSNRTHRWIVYGKYENPFFLNWTRKYLPPDGIIVDSGANIGQMLLYFGQWVPEGKFIAFEPGTEQASWLEECLVFHKDLKVEVIRRGLGAFPTQQRLKNFGDTSIHGAWAAVSETEGEPIQIVRLADELATRSLEKVDLWKLDVQFYELPALEGAIELLKEHRIKALWVELSGEKGLPIKDYLANFGYQCYAFNKWGKLYKPSQLTNVHDGLFLPN